MPPVQSARDVPSSDSRPRGRPRKVAPLDVVARPRGGRSSDSIARARSLGRIARLADVGAVRLSVPVSAWSYPQILARRQEEINIVQGPGFAGTVGGVDGLSADEARRLACYRAEFRFCFQHDDFRGLQTEVLFESGVRKDVIAV